MNQPVEVSEITVNFDKFTLVKVVTDKGPYQVSLRGHGFHPSKIDRVAKSIENIMKGPL